MVHSIDLGLSPTEGANRKIDLISQAPFAARADLGRLGIVEEVTGSTWHEPRHGDPRRGDRESAHAVGSHRGALVTEDWIDAENMPSSRITSRCSPRMWRGGR